MEICAELKPLADDIREWAIANATKDYVVDTGKNTYCTACGTCHKSGDLTYDKDRWSVCPSCGKRVQHDEAKSPKAAYVAYFAVLETLHDWQVIRYYAIKMTWTRGGGKSHLMHEVMRKWEQPHEEEITQGVPLGLVSYSSLTPFSLSIDKMEIRDSKPPKYPDDWMFNYYEEWFPLEVYPQKQILPYYADRGVKSFDIYSPSEMFGAIFACPHLERMWLDGEAERLRNVGTYAAYHLMEHYPSLCLATERGYDIGAVGYKDWLQMCDRLKYLRKDLLDPANVCPADFKASKQSVDEAYYNRRNRAH